MDDLERREEAHEEEARTHVFGSAKSGWKKGFFSQEKPKKTAKAAAGTRSSSDPAVAVPKAVAELKESSAASSGSKPADSSGSAAGTAVAVEAGATPRSGAAHNHPHAEPSRRAVTERVAPAASSDGNAAAGASTKKSVAFTGVVKERL